MAPHSGADPRRLFLIQRRACDSAFQHDGSFNVVLCPVCMRGIGPPKYAPETWFGPTSTAPLFSVEHAPPKQSNVLGAGRECCVTCRPCNNGSAFEQQTARNREQLQVVASSGMGKLRWLVDGESRPLRTRLNEYGVEDVVPPPFEHHLVLDIRLQPFEDLTNLKAGFVIAFSVLGYRWATSPALDAVRSAISAGDRGPVGRPSTVTLNAGSEDAANHVLISEDTNQVLVVGNSGRRGVVLPLSPELPPSESFATFAGFGLPWLPDRWWHQSELAFEPFIWDRRPPTFLRTYWQLDVAGSLDDTL